MRCADRRTEALPLKGQRFFYNWISFRVSPRAYGPGGRIGNRVKNPDGTAAVSAETAPVDESRPLGNREGRVRAAGDFSAGASQKTCSEWPCRRQADNRAGNVAQEYGCCNPRDCCSRFCFIPNAEKGCDFPDPACLTPRSSQGARLRGQKTRRPGQR